MPPKKKTDLTQNEAAAPAKVSRARRVKTTAATPEEPIETPLTTAGRKRKVVPKAENGVEDKEPAVEAGARRGRIEAVVAPPIQAATTESAEIPTSQPTTAAASKKRKAAESEDVEDGIFNGEGAAEATASVAKKQRTSEPETNIISESQPPPPQIPKAPPTSVPQDSSAVADASGKVKAKSKHDCLYDACIKAKPIGANFDAEELRKLGIADNDQELLDLTQELIRRFLFIAMTLTKGLIYRTRSKAVAIKLAQLSADSLLVYTIIEGAGSVGIWRRPLESRTNLHQSNVARALKDLHAEKLVKEFKAFKSTRRTWITYDITPSAETLGGSFVVDNGKFDVGLVDAVTTAVVSYIEEQSWAERPPPPKQADHKPSSKTHHKHKSKTPGATPAVTEDTPAPSEAPHLQPPPNKENAPIFRPSLHKNGNLMVPHHPSFTKYPTVLDVMFELNDKKISKITLNQDDTQQILNKMEFDGFIERMRDDQGRLGDGYRSVRRVWQQQRFGSSRVDFGLLEPNEYSGVLPGNGLSQVPCVRCPVRELCKPGGVVSPEQCEYLGDWMAF